MKKSNSSSVMSKKLSQMLLFSAVVLGVGTAATVGNTRTASADTTDNAPTAQVNSAASSTAAASSATSDVSASSAATSDASSTSSIKNSASSNGSSEASSATSNAANSTAKSTVNVASDVTSAASTTTASSSANVATSNATSTASSAVYEVSRASVMAASNDGASVASSSAITPRAGVEVLANGSMTVDGSAVGGLSYNATTGVTTGKLSYHYTSQDLGASFNQPAEFVLSVPAAFQDAVKASSDPASYFSGDYAVSLLGFNVASGTFNNIQVASDGSYVTFTIPAELFQVQTQFSVNANFNLGGLVTETGVRIAPDTNNYLTDSVLTTQGSLINWDLFGNRAATAYLNTNNIDPKYADQTTGVQAPYVVQPVTDQDTAVTGVAQSNATVTLTTAAGVTLGTATANSAGYFSFSIPTQKEGTTLNVTQTVNGKTSPATSVTVEHKAVTLTAPSINAMYAGDTTVSGQSSADYAGYKVTTVDTTTGNTLGSAYVGTDGSYSIKTSALVYGDSVAVYVENNSGDQSRFTYKGVQAAQTVPAPTAAIATIGRKAVTGTGNTPGDTVIVYDLKTDKELGRSLVQSDKTFTINLQNPIASGDMFYAVETNGTATSSKFYFYAMG